MNFSHRTTTRSDQWYHKATEVLNAGLCPKVSWSGRRRSCLIRAQTIQWTTSGSWPTRRNAASTCGRTRPPATHRRLNIPTFIDPTRPAPPNRDTPRPPALTTRRSGAACRCIRRKARRCTGKCKWVRRWRPPRCPTIDGGRCRSCAPSKCRTRSTWARRTHSARSTWPNGHPHRIALACTTWTTKYRYRAGVGTLAPPNECC